MWKAVLAGIITAVAAISLYRAIDNPDVSTEGTVISPAAANQMQIQDEPNPRRMESNQSALPTVTLNAITSKPVVTSFGSSHDIWAFAEKALHSTSSPETYEAYIGTKECVGVASQWNDYATFAGGGSAVQMTGALEPARQLAIQELGSKCAGFLKIGLKASIALLHSLQSHGEELNGPEFASLKPDPDGRRFEDVGSLVFSDSPAAVETGLPTLASLWAFRTGVGQTGDNRGQLMSIAALLAACDLGKDCSESGYSAQLLCATTGRCDSALWSDWRNGLTDEDIESVEKYKTRLIIAIKARNLDRLGPG